MARRKDWSASRLSRSCVRSRCNGARQEHRAGLQGSGISEQSYYRWRKEYGGLKVDQAKRMKELGAGERPAQEACCRSVAGKAGAQGYCLGKIVSPERRRQAVERLREKYGLSERQACRIVGQPRGTQRYVPIVQADEDALTQSIIELASEYGRYGYRRMTALLNDARLAGGQGSRSAHLAP